MNSKLWIGPYQIAVDDFTFGVPTRYYQFNPKTLFPNFKNLTEQEISEKWDEAIHKASEIYSEVMWNLVIENCHTYNARALNEMNVKFPISLPIIGNSWNMVNIAMLMFFKSKFVRLDIHFFLVIYSYFIFIINKN